MKKTLLLILTLAVSPLMFAQDCNCEKNFHWVQKTFEENDAGFKYVLNNKGAQAYTDHNKRMLEKVRGAKTLNDCAPLLYEWLSFFRTGHIAIRPKQTGNNQNLPDPVKQFKDWETIKVDMTEFEAYLKTRKEADYEGIWETPPYKIGIKREGDHYRGFIIESGAETWTKGQVKLKIRQDKDTVRSTFYMRDHTPVESNLVEMIGNNHLQIGNFILTRISPAFRDDKQIEDYFRLLYASGPYLERLNPTTLYFRIPSFNHQAKPAIDSVITVNRENIHRTENLIIDIRNGTGGSDGSYKEIMSIIYTNPIRIVGVEYLSTKLNNGRMMEFINNVEYGFDEEGKKWARESYAKLEKRLGQFVNLDSNVVSIERYDTIHPFPRNVGIIINNGNGSTDEQFLLAAKQSKKVKLFGATTFGVLDISNMYFVDSPCKEFELGYSLTRSMRIPEMTIDAKGIQPDYYLDKTIPKYKWVEYVNAVLNEK